MTLVLCVYQEITFPIFFSNDHSIMVFTSFVSYTISPCEVENTSPSLIKLYLNSDIEMLGVHH